jgi:hypothetical protein
LPCFSDHSPWLAGQGADAWIGLGQIDNVIRSAHASESFDNLLVLPGIGKAVLLIHSPTL